MDLCAGEAKVPVSRHGFRGGKTGVAVVEGGEGEAGVAAEDDGGEGEGETAVDGETGYQCRHEELVGHWVYHAADDRLQMPAAGDPAVEQIGQRGVGEERKGIQMVVVDDEVANHGGGDQPGEGKHIGQVVDLLMARLVEFERRLERRGEFGGC